MSGGSRDFKRALCCILVACSCPHTYEMESLRESARTKQHESNRDYEKDG